MSIQIHSSDQSITAVQEDFCTWDLTIAPNTNNKLVYGGVVTWLQDYDFYVSPAGYYINNVFYESPEAYITLSPSDPLLDRFDVIYVDADGVVKVLEGTPSLTPSVPGLDLGLQLGLGVVFIEAGSTSPTGIIQECISQDNGEWTAIASDGDIDPASVSAPCTGVSSVEATNADNGDYILFDRGTTFPPMTSFNVLTFRLKPKLDWGTSTGHKLILRFRLAGIQVGLTVEVTHGAFNFDATSTTCQIISIPMVNFGIPTTSSVDQFQVTVSSDSGDFGFFIDSLCLQGGIFVNEGDFIWNQYFGPQSNPGHFWIRLNGRADGWFTSPQRIGSSELFYGGSEKFGWGSNTTSSEGTALGYYASAAQQGTAVGSLSSAANFGDTAIGRGAQASGGVALGWAAQALFSNSTALGTAATITGVEGTAVGYNNTAGQAAVALGWKNTASYVYSMAFGYRAETSAIRQVAFGSIYSNEGVSDFYFGNSERVSDQAGSTGNPGTYSINVSGATGTDKDGGIFVLGGSKGTGAGLSGPFSIRTSDPTISGTTLQTLSEKVGLNSNTKGLFLTNTRFQMIEGADVASTGNLTLGTGNYFAVTGSTTINAITSTNWQDGAVIYLLFTGAPTLKHNTVGGAGTSPIRLAGAVDFAATANTVLALGLKDGYWREVGRTQASAIGPYTFVNGLHEELGGIVKLGGVLIEETEISLATNTFKMTESGGRQFFIEPTSSTVAMGDYDGVLNPSFNAGWFQITGGDFQMFAPSPGYVLDIDTDNFIWRFGDIDGGNNSTLLTLDDSTRNIILSAGVRTIIDGRFEEDKGIDVVAANDLTLGLDGNLFIITGSTQINAITTANWQAGSKIGFVFSGAPTLKHNTAGGGGTATMLLAGSVDFVAAAGDYIEFRYDGTNWHEVGRKIVASGGTFLGIPLQNSLFVSKLGSDGTGLRTRLDLPFLTITAALAAASSGDTVFVYPGVYEEAATMNLKNGVSFYFLGKGEVQLNTGVPNGFLFRDNSVQVTSRIFAPEWNFTARLNQTVLATTNGTGSVIDFTFYEATSVTSGIIDTFQGTITAKGYRAYASNGPYVINTPFSTVTFNIDVIEAGITGNCLYTEKNPYYLVNAKRIFQNSANGDYCVYVEGSGVDDKYYIRADEIHSGTEWAVYINGSGAGDATLNAYVDAQNITGDTDCVVVAGTFAALTVRAERIESTAAATDGILHAESGILTVIGARVIRDPLATGYDIRSSLTGTVKLIACSYDRNKINELSGAGTIRRIDSHFQSDLTIYDGRFQWDKGTNTASANDLTLPSDGNLVIVSGAVQINAITTANWQAGSFVMLEFSGTPTIKHNTAGGAGTAVILLSGAVDYVAAANDVLTLVYDGTSWHETARKSTAVGSTGILSADNGLSLSTATNVQWFGPVGTPATLLNDRYLTAADKTVNITFNSLGNAKGLNLTSTSTASSGDTNNKLLYIGLSGANANSNATTYGAFIENSHTGTGSSNYGLFVYAASGGSNTAISALSSGQAVVGTSTGNAGGTFSTSAAIYALGAENNNDGSNAYAARLMRWPTSTNTVKEVLRINRQVGSGVGAIGVGASVGFYLATDGALGYESYANEIISKYTAVTDGAQTSQMDIKGIFGGVTNTIMSAYGSGVVGIGISSSYGASRLHIVDATLSDTNNVKVQSTVAAVGNNQNGINSIISGTLTSGSQTTSAIRAENTVNTSAVGGINHAGEFIITGAGQVNRAISGSASGGTVFNVGVYGVANGGPLNNTGVYGESTTANGIGVYGNTNIASALGMFGANSSGSGIAVQGYVSGAAAGNAIGLYGVSALTTGTGTAVYGASEGISTGTNIGATFRAKSASTANYALLVPPVTGGGENAGNVGFGTVTPNATAMVHTIAFGTGNAHRAESTSGTTITATATTGVAGYFANTSSNVPLQTYAGGGTPGASLAQIDTSTNTVIAGIQIARDTTGTAANGIGTSIDFHISTTTTANQQSSRIYSKWVNATHASRTADIVFQTTESAGALADVLTLAGNGSVKLRTLTATAASAITPSDGMLVYVGTTDGTFTSIGFWGRENGVWVKM